jgi:hypothetical protein
MDEFLHSRTRRHTREAESRSALPGRAARNSKLDRPQHTQAPPGQPYDMGMQPPLRLPGAPHPRVGASAVARSRQRSLRTIAAPRVGFDRVVVNPSIKRPIQFGETLGQSYRRVRDHRIDGRVSAKAINRRSSTDGDRLVARDVRRSYRRHAEYRPVSGVGPIVDVLHERTGGPNAHLLPPYRVQLRAPMRRLLDVATIESVTAEISAALDAKFYVSEAEVSVDLPWQSGAWAALRAELYSPWTRRHRERVDEEWLSRGDRRSASWIRAYSKREDGLRVVRVELVLKRDGLRRLGVQRAADLRDVSWQRVVTRALRFVAMAPAARGERRVVRRMLARVAELEGVQATLRKRHGRGRERMRRRLRPTPTQHAVERALAAFDRAQQAAPASAPRAGSGVRRGSPNGSLVMVPATPAARRPRGNT